MAGLILAASSIVRAGLEPELDGHSPYMLYVAAVLAAAFFRGGFCGLLVLLGGGVAGFYFFAEPQGVWDKEPGVSAALALYLVVGGLVLLTAHELRRQVNGAFERLRRQLAQDRGPALGE